MLEEKTSQNIFKIQRLYIKDVSFEVPYSPNVFDKILEPTIELNLNTVSKKIKSNVFEVILKIKIIVKNKKLVLFVCDVDQAGIFFICNFKEKKLKYCLHAYCPNILFPYARSCISTLVAYSSFPQINLDPVDFDFLYFDHLQRQRQKI
jgi:preprotein translocase subunit SecB